MSSNIQSTKLAIALRRLDDLTDWERRPRGSMQVNVEPVLDLAHRLGDPHHSFQTVHVAGTKGKGSTCSLIAAGLQQAGLKVGRYASPHLSHISERVVVNGCPVDEDCLADALAEALEAFEAARDEGTHGQSATWFDVLTVTAFLIFRTQGVEWAVVEAGLGGRLDSTNIVRSEVAVITNIDLEHTEVLGSTRGAIAFEKAGIIKAGSIVITPIAEEDEAGDVIARRAHELGCDVRRPSIPSRATIEARNVIVAGTALDAMNDLHIEAGAAPHKLGAELLDRQTIESARLPGRLDVRKDTVATSSGSREVSIVFDGAHVPFNLRAVLADLALDKQYSRPCSVVMALAEDKDAIGLLSALDPAVYSLLFTTLGAKFRDPNELKDIADERGFSSKAIGDPHRAYDNALQAAADANGWVLVTGSLHLVGTVMNGLRNSTGDCPLFREEAPPTPSIISGRSGCSDVVLGSVVIESFTRRNYSWRKQE